MYKVMIVDDEAPARALLQMKVDWDSIDCVVSATAKNGKEALALYKDHKPDLVITDIQMPVMNGLELIGHIKALDPKQAIVILSCHESFSFARKAIQLGVNDYLIKDSFETEELYSIITDMFKTTTIKDDPHPFVDYSVQDTQKAVATLDLIKSPMDSLSQQTLIKQHNLQLEGHQLILFYIDVELIGQDVTKPLSQFLSDEDMLSIMSLLRGTLKKFAHGEVCHDDGNTFMVLYNATISHSPIECRKEAITIANHMRQVINERFFTQTTIGVSHFITELSNLNDAYIESQNAVNRKIISGYDKTYLSNASSTSGEDQYIKILNVKLNRINDAFDDYKFEPIIKEVKDIFLQNLKGFMQYNYLKHTNWTLLSIVIDFCSRNSLSFMDLCGSRSPWEDIMNIKTVDGMCHWFVINIEKINKNLKTTPKSTHSYHVAKCIKYIHQHYDENISLRDLSIKYDINNAYLSRIFKKETGNSLTDYTNNVRIEEAKKLVENTTLKMYEIAEQCGFSSTQRFFMVFKKVVGTSPGDYRKH